MNRMLIMIEAFALMAGAASASPAAAAAAAPKAGAAEIPFVDHGAIRDWTAPDDSTLYVEANQGKWYQVDLASPCFGLPFAYRIGVDTGPIDTLDSFSTIIADGQRCPVAKVSALASPPPRLPSRHKS